jgi:hypothetical protein
MKKLTYTPDANSLGYIENAPDYINSVALAVGVAKSFTKPVGARFVRLSAGALFYYNPNGAATTGTVDVTAGTGSVSVPATVQPLFCVDDIAAISVIASAACVVSAEFWG